MWEQIRANQRRSIILILGMALVLLLLGTAVGGAFSREHVWVGTAIAIAIWAVLWLAAVAAGKEIVLASAGARRITHDDIPRLFNVVEEMTIAAALPKMPKVYLIDHDMPNAFACGTPKDAAVAVTTGLLTRLNRDELQGVIAHEIGHIKNNDTKFMTLAGVLMGAIVLLADGFLRGLFFSGRGRRRGPGGGQGAAIFLLIAIALAILAPLCAQLLYFACSRRREYLADACAARFTRYPEGLASALEKIEASAARMRKVNRVVAPMYIVNPLKGASAASLFSTHPPTADRVRVLRSMAGGAGFAQYEAAFRKVHRSGVLGAGTLQQADDAPIRAPSAAPEEPPLAKAREAVDTLHRLGGYLFLACPCGLKMKIPPTYKGDDVTCPRCGRSHVIPRAAVMATAAALEADAAEGRTDEGKASGGTHRPEPPQVFKYSPGRWQSFRCACGNAIQLSPAFAATQVRCRSCGRAIRTVRE